MDTRFSKESLALREMVDRLGRQLAPGSVEAIADTNRSQRLVGAVEEAGLLTLRDDAGSGRPLAEAVDVGLVAQGLARHLADTPFIGRIVTAELLRHAGCGQLSSPATIALDPEAASIAVWSERTLRPSIAIDAAGAEVAVGLVPAEDGGFSLGVVGLPNATTPIDLTRPSSVIPGGATVELLVGATLSPEAVRRSEILGRVIATCDLVGAMQGALALAHEYAQNRSQYGTLIGSFQAVQHALAEAAALAEGSVSVALHASWAVDGADERAARHAADVAKVYCARAGRQVAETAVQIHGGIGNTWECLAHVYLRRIIHSAELFGTGAARLERLANELLSTDLVAS